EGWTSQGGARQWGFMVGWALPFLTAADLFRHRERVADFDGQRNHLADLVDRLPATAEVSPLTILPHVGEHSAYFLDWLAHSSRDDFWRSVSIQDRHEQIGVPALNV